MAIYYLLALIRKAISIHEAPTFGGMAMQVHIIRHTPLLGRNGFLFFFLWGCYFYSNRSYSL